MSKVWHCNTELIWGGDHDTEDNEDYEIVSNLSCPKCHNAVDVWHPSEKLIKEYKAFSEKKADAIKICLYESSYPLLGKQVGGQDFVKYENSAGGIYK